MWKELLGLLTAGAILVGAAFAVYGVECGDGNLDFIDCPYLGEDVHEKAEELGTELSEGEEQLQQGIAAIFVMGFAGMIGYVLLGGNRW